MRKLTVIAVAVFSISSGAALAQTGGTVVASEPGKVAIADTVRAAATVEAIDKANRLVTLKGAEGNSFVVQAGPEVKNFDQIKVGDQVVVRYSEALVLQLKKGGGGVRERVESEGGATAKPGQKPGAVVGRKVTVVADVIGVDAAKQSIRVKGPKRTVDLKVRDPNQFKLIKVGDQIEATYTEAVAVAVEPAAKK
jgi:hypothetical protein